LDVVAADVLEDAHFFVGGVDNGVAVELENLVAYGRINDIQNISVLYRSAWDFSSNFKAGAFSTGFSSYMIIPYRYSDDHTSYRNFYYFRKIMQ